MYSRFAKFTLDRAPCQAFLKPFRVRRPHRLRRHVLLTHATVARVSFPPNFHLQVLNFYCLRSPAPPGFNFAYFCSTSFRTRPCLRFLRHFPPPAPAGSVFSCGLVCRQFATSRLSIGRKSPVCQTTIFPPAYCTSIWWVPCQHSCWFKSFHYVVPAFPVLVGWSRISSRTSSHCSVMSLPHLLHCCKKLFLLRRSPVRPIAG